MEDAAANPKLKTHFIMLTAYSNRHRPDKEKERAALHMEGEGADVPQNMVEAYT